MHILCIYYSVCLPICTYSVYLTSSGQVSAFGVIYALYIVICMVIFLLYHCYTTVSADCILYQVYQWYSHRIWHISQWKVCYMPQRVPPDSFLDSIQVYISYTICYTMLYLHTRMLYFCIGMIYRYISAATTLWVPSRINTAPPDDGNNDFGHHKPSTRAVGLAADVA